MQPTSPRWFPGNPHWCSVAHPNSCKDNRCLSKVSLCSPRLSCTQDCSVDPSYRPLPQLCLKDSPRPSSPRSSFPRFPSHKLSSHSHHDKVT
jgi:hypothetical protein